MRAAVDLRVAGFFAADEVERDAAAVERDAEADLPRVDGDLPAVVVDLRVAAGLADDDLRAVEAADL
ncbi:MAG TPA: hypothetical protein VEY49_00760, partial [Solirubrobacteraceae bacterium]|nr:hypothetical protein [Solirubrobacteraceae bacterium]